MRLLGLILMAIGASPLAWTVSGVISAYSSLRDASLDLASTEGAERVLQMEVAKTLKYLPYGLPLIALGLALYVAGWRRRRRAIIRKQA
ncbi:MAG: hypothetical protein IT449_02685 [Phycisphaerales bacterium]|nr:hypothetical protein [Phycisphaerales bacterium]